MELLGHETGKETNSAGEEMGALTYVRRMLRPVPRFERMVEVLDLKGRMESLSEGAAVVRRAETRCRGCSEPTACCEWLDAREMASEAPEYCRNHDLFERLIDQDGKERQTA